MPDALDKQQDMCLLCICAAACGAMHHVRPGANECDHVAAAPPMTVLESSTGTLRCAALALPGVAADNHTPTEEEYVQQCTAQPACWNSYPFEVFAA